MEPRSCSGVHLYNQHTRTTRDPFALDFPLRMGKRHTTASIYFVAGAFFLGCSRAELRKPNHLSKYQLSAAGDRRSDSCVNVLAQMFLWDLPSASKRFRINGFNDRPKAIKKLDNDTLNLYTPHRAALGMLGDELNRLLERQARTELLEQFEEAEQS